MTIIDRRKRSASCPESHDNSENEYDDTVLATYTVVRAALNSVEVEGECLEKFMCEGGAELRRRGEGGRMLVEMGGELLGERRQHGLLVGFTGGNCRTKYQDCRDIPNHYRVPGVGGGGAYTDPVNIIQIIKQAVQEKFRR